MKQLLDWLDQRTGLSAAGADWFQRPVAGGPAWRFVWPSTIAFAFVTQAVTGLVLWMYYSPGALSAWESVYYLQHEVQGGWLLRAVHYYGAQVTLVLVGIYLAQMILRGVYRAPREFLFWTVLLIGLVTLALNLTGDLLAWDQNSFWCTRVRTGFLYLLPGIGGSLFKLAAGGPEFGSLTLTRFLALHAGLFTAALAGLLTLHAWLARRHGLEGSATGRPAVPYWPRQAVRDMAACLVVLAVILALSMHHGVSGPEAGVELGAPADPVSDPGTARPEWSFRGLYQFRELFPSSVEILPIFVFSGLTVLVFFAMPLVAKLPFGHVLNLACTAVVLGGLLILSWQSYAKDGRDEKYREALDAGRQQAQRVKELAAAHGIPVTGALTLLRDDPKSQGPQLFRQYCASCHDTTDADGKSHREDAATAPDLRGFAGRDWIRGLLDPKAIAGPRYYGNTKFKKGKMVDYVKNTMKDADPKDVEQYIVALSAEAGLKSQHDADVRDAGEIAKGSALMATDCTDCHTLGDKGASKGPDMTGYGNREWLIGIIGDPTHKRFYGKDNDRMPSYAGTRSDPKSRILSDRQIELLADWLRGQWYETEEN